MKLSLLYNRTAGTGITVDEICRLLTRHGHSLVQVVERRDSPQPIAGDALVAAGGDGTVASAARRVASGERPIAILPMGTANNIAKSLDIDGSFDQIVETWGTQDPRSIDLGFVHGPWGVGRFVESVGAGLIARGIGDATERKARGIAEKPTVEAGARGYLDTLSTLEPAAATIEIEGEVLKGDFLLIEILNMPLIGSNLRLSREVEATDGQLSVVTIAADQRDLLEQYLVQRTEDPASIAPFGAQRSNHVDIHGWPALHVDDVFHAIEPNTRISVEIDPGALRVL